MRLILIYFLLIAAKGFSQVATYDPYFAETTDTVSAAGPKNITRHIHQDKKGQVWLATWQGIIRYDPATKLFTNHTLKDKLIHFHVFSIMEDKSGNIWFGTIRGGAYRYEATTKKFTLFNTNNGLANNEVGALMEDGEGYIWFGTEDGLSRYDTSAMHQHTAKASFATLSGLPLTSRKGFITYNTDKGLCNNRINTLLHDINGKIWIGTRNGVSIYDPYAVPAFSDFKISEGRAFTNVRCIKETRDGKIWIAGQDGLYLHDPSILDGVTLKKISDKFVGYIFEDKEGMLWLNAGLEKGMALYKYDPSGPVEGETGFKKIIEKTERGDEQIFEITQDTSGNIWFGTMKGVCRYDGKEFENFRK
jgi:ligand-binding sensor domain-containing protein